MVFPKDNSRNKNSVPRKEDSSSKLEKLKKQIDDVSDLTREIEKLMISYPYQVRIKALRSVSATLGMQVVGFNQSLTAFIPGNTIANKVAQSPVGGITNSRIEQPATKNISWRKTPSGRKIEKEIVKLSSSLKSASQGTPEMEDLECKLAFLKRKKEEYKLYLSGITSINDGSNRESNKKKTRGRKDPLSTLQFKDDGSLLWSSINYRNFRAYVAQSANKDSEEKEVSQISEESGEHCSPETPTNN